jgi:lipoate-protein ligase A
LPLTGDLTRIFNCLQLDGGGADRRSAQEAAGAALLAHACTLEEALGRSAPFEEVAQALARGFSDALNLHLEPAGLTEHERGLAERLCRDQYAGDAWNRRI